VVWGGAGGRGLWSWDREWAWFFRWLVEALVFDTLSIWFGLSA